MIIYICTMEICMYDDIWHRYNMIFLVLWRSQKNAVGLKNKYIDSQTNKLQRQSKINVNVIEISAATLRQPNGSYHCKNFDVMIIYCKHND